jgi:hypothetical protein
MLYFSGQRYNLRKKVGESDGEKMGKSRKEIKQSIPKEINPEQLIHIILIYK